MQWVACASLRLDFDCAVQSMRAYSVFIPQVITNNEPVVISANGPDCRCLKGWVGRPRSEFSRQLREPARRVKVCMADRRGLFALLRATFKQLDCSPLIAEIGVLRGDNARALHRALGPGHMWLVDPWKAYERFHYPFDERPPYIAAESTFSDYFGGSLLEQATFDDLYDQCVAAFQDETNVTFVRQDSIKGLDTVVAQLEERSPPRKHLDLAYIDADHQYEYVLRDLMLWGEHIAPEGILMLNDCCHSENGLAQNLGVLEAVSHFVKRSDFVPLVLTNTDFSDVILARHGSAAQQHVDRLLEHSIIPFVEVPDSLLPAARVKRGDKRVNLSFA